MMNDKFVSLYQASLIWRKELWAIVPSISPGRNAYTLHTSRRLCVGCVSSPQSLTDV